MFAKVSDTFSSREELVVELHLDGSAINGATPSSYRKNQQNKRPHYQYTASRKYSEAVSKVFRGPATVPKENVAGSNYCLFF